MSTTTEQPDTTATKMGVFTTAGAMGLLWQKAERELHTHELKWLANGASEHVSLETSMLADVLMRLGGMVSSDTEAGSFGTQKSVSNLLFNISNQVSAINGLAQIADFAGYRLRQALKDQRGGADD